MKFLFKDSGTGQNDGAKTLNTITWAVCLVKITLSGATIFGHTFAVITPDVVNAYAMLMGITGATYGGRALTKAMFKGKSE